MYLVSSSISWLQVDVREEEEEFQGLITACLSVLLLAVQTRLDVPLQQMARMPWGTMEQVPPPPGGNPHPTPTLLTLSPYVLILCSEWPGAGG